MVKINDVLNLKPRTTNPASAEEGDIYYNSSDKKLKYHDNSGWKDIGDLGGTEPWLYGTGSDGAFSGSKVLEQGKVYQYTNFNLGAGETLSTNSTTGELITIKVQGNCTIYGTINLEGKGVNKTGTELYTNGKNGGKWGTLISGDAKGGIGGNPYTLSGLDVLPFYPAIVTIVKSGTKGGTGGTGNSAGGTGGNGGGSIIFIIGGDITFGNLSEIDCKGSDGTNGNTPPP